MASLVTSGPGRDGARVRTRPRDVLAPRVRWTFVGFGVLVVLLLAVAVPQSFGIRSRVSDLRERWVPVRAQAAALGSAFADQESSERGYVITADPSYLAPYEKAKPVVAAAFADLRGLLHGDDRGAALLATVRQRYDRWRVDVAENEIGLVAARRQPEALAAVRTGTGKALFTRLRRSEDAFVRYTDARLSDSIGSVGAADDRLLVALLATAGVILVIVLAARSVFGRWAARRDRDRDTERQLADQTELLLRVTNTSPDPIFLKDADGRYVFLNDGTARAIGGGRSSTYVGQRDVDIFEPDEGSIVRRDDALTRASSEVMVFEEQVGGRLFETTKTAFPFADGSVGVLGIARDVTERTTERQRLAAVAAVTRAVAIHGTVEHVANAARTSFSEATGAEVVWVFVTDRERRGLLPVLRDGTRAATDHEWQFLPIDAPTFTTDAVRTGRPRVAHVEDVDPESVSYGIFASEELATVAYLPFPGGASTEGVVNLGWRRHTAPDDEELEFYLSLVGILAEGIARAQSTELERQAVHAFQRLLLPADFPAGVQVAVRYEPALALEVGGDWYDVFSLPGGRIGLAVGDVVGHGVDAAAQMAQLSSVLRAAAVTDDDPGAVLDALDRFASAEDGLVAATVCYAVLDLERRELQYSCAGHLPPLLSDGTTRYLEGARSTPVGFGLGLTAPRPSARVPLTDETVLVLYTDGLVEQRGQPIDDGLGALARAVGASADAPVEQLASAVVDALSQQERRDDAALLCLRVPGRLSQYFHVRIPANPTFVRTVRVELRGWLDAHAVEPEAIDDIVGAVTEAVSNSVEHAYQRDGVGRVVVEATADGAVLVTVRDRGQWTQQVRGADRGRGFLLMEALMDDVHVERAVHGTTIRLRKDLEHSPTNA
jgi:PAS domain S-box-containing protein